MFPPAKSLVTTLFLVAGLSAQTAPAPKDAAPKDTAKQALDLLLAQRYPDLTAMFSESLKKTVTIEFLQGQVTAELTEFGKPQSIGDVVLGVDGGNNLVSFPVQFSNTSIHIQFTLNRAGEIAGLYFRPPNKALPLIWSRPAYSKPDAFHERDVTIGSEPWELAGTLTTPATAGRVPGLILVHGPGPNDRNEAMFATRIFEDLAEGLSSRGYAVLRYEKRTRTYGDELSRSGYTLDEETVQDAVAAAALLRKQPEVDPNRVYVLGHSLGGYAAPRIAAADGKLAGLILLAGLARSVEDAGLEQTEYVTHLKGDPAPAEQARLDRLKAEVERVRTLDPKADNPMVVMGLPTAWWLNVKGYDPPAAARKLDLPMLVLQGERDFQVTMKDFALWQSALSGDKAVIFHSYPTLNDLFIAGQGKGSPAEYHALGNVAPAVIDDIAAWLSTQKQ